MHILLTAIGSAGDVHPFAGVGARLKARGHRVTLVANPRFKELIDRLGFDFVPIGTVEEFDEVTRNADLWHPTRAFRTVVEFGILPIMRPIYDLVAERYIPGETVIGAHGLDFGSRIAHEKLGVPLATMHLAPAVFRSETLPPVLLPWMTGRHAPGWASRLLYWLADSLLADRLLAGPVNAMRSQLDLPPVRRLLHDWWFSPQRVIGLFPDWFGPPQADWPPQTVLTGFPLWDASDLMEIPDEVSRFLDRGEPPIVFTPGSAMLHGHDFFAAAVDACLRTGRRGVLLTRCREQIPNDLPAAVAHFDYVPLSRILPRSAAIVHHGGIGTVSQGLAAGVPQLVMPMAHDQHDNAARLERLGVAVSLRPRAFRGPAVARALARLVESADVAAHCRRAADRLVGGDPIEATCRQLERLGGGAG